MLKKIKTQLINIINTTILGFVQIFILINFNFTYILYLVILIIIFLKFFIEKFKFFLFLCLLIKFLEIIIKRFYMLSVFIN